ncbi:MAG TPA: VacB/RNase II family 3'-5' exoribonuclease [Clostridiales bacterium]|nr:VacB/RNase II family 3'-5' exoribonuclease [Clostridiales bacterium]
MTFGCAENAVSCANSILTINGIETEFPFKALKEAKKLSDAGIQDFEYNNREDLRNECVFTIDSAEAKDLDDAISITKHSDHYELGVHIADVSYYVKGNSALDKEALNRGTSVYYANKVVPMLPKELSNGICSLHPNEDRLTFSAFIKIDFEGKLTNYTFKKTVINSKVKGVYAEINTILSGDATPEILEKYAAVKDNLLLMNELADLLIACKKRRGAPQIETVESKLLIDENDICVGIVPRTRGKSEMIIEEFMLLANEAAANFARIKELPFVYRIHDEPTLEKMAKLKDTLQKINVSYPQVDKFKPAHLAQILDNARESTMFPVINTIVLRSMAKAKYAPDPIGHFGLALADYAHFTSPIRRYPDFSIHRILSDAIMGYDTKWLEKRYSAFAANSSEKSSHAEVTAMNVERDCEDCYKAEFMQKHIGEDFEGMISSVVEYGVYVMLDNTVEGLVHINSFPSGNYSYDGFMSITEGLSNKKYTLGDKVWIKCAKATVSSGDIDFVFADGNELQSEE